MGGGCNGGSVMGGWMLWEEGVVGGGCSGSMLENLGVIN